MLRRLFFAAALCSAPTAAQVAAGTAPDDAAPIPPARVPASYAAPPTDAAGRYVTPNRDLSPAEVTWHVRAGLNVAALGCRGAAEAETVAAYNAVLAADAAVLTLAAAGTEAAYRARHGEAWHARNDDAMTRLYNFFAEPEAADDFCAAALAVLREAQAVEPSNFATFAAAALPRLEAPFLRFYAAWDRYKAALAEWEARHRAPAAIVQTPPTPAPALIAAVARPTPPLAAPPNAEPASYVTVMVPVRVAVPAVTPVPIAPAPVPAASEPGVTPGVAPVAVAAPAAATLLAAVAVVPAGPRP